jgi:tetratricopeptide (TPR) repeat protein
MDILADRLFEKTFESQLQLCSEFPHSATLFNETAWLCARSQRRLDQARELIQQAISLEADVAAYYDTLAEVQFQQGNRQAAVAAARRCLDLTGPTKQSTARFKHFSESELGTLDDAR